MCAHVSTPYIDSLGARRALVAVRLEPIKHYPSIGIGPCRKSSDYLGMMIYQPRGRGDRRQLVMCSETTMALPPDGRG